jgi:hypothetical protein
MLSKEPDRAGQNYDRINSWLDTVENRREEDVLKRNKRLKIMNMNNKIQLERRAAGKYFIYALIPRPHPSMTFMLAGPLMWILILLPGWVLGMFHISSSTLSNARIRT